MQDRFPELVHQIAARRDSSIHAELLSYEHPVEMTAALGDRLAVALHGLALLYLRLPSFAGHDMNQLARLAPVAMLFVPSRGGRSHCPEEWTAPEELVTGARALFASVCVVDAALGCSLLPRDRR